MTNRCRVDYGHAEAAAAYGKDPRRYAVMSKRFVLNQGNVVGIEIVQVGARPAHTPPWHISLRHLLPFPPLSHSEEMSFCPCGRRSLEQTFSGTFLGSIGWAPHREVHALPMRH